MNVDDIRSMEMLPKLIHTYQHHHLDSTRWAHFTPRDDDIVISTPYKSGTTWTPEIVLHLVFLGREVPYRGDVSPWLDNRFHPLEEVLSSEELTMYEHTAAKVLTPACRTWLEQGRSALPLGAMASRF